MQATIFTKIISGDIPAHKLYEDETVLAFLDIHPARPGHTLVIPKKQVDHLNDLPEADYQAVMAVARRLMTHLRDTLKTKRTCMKVEGFDVPHAHVHLIPCDSAADLHTEPAAHAEPDRDALAAMAEKLRLAN